MVTGPWWSRTGDSVAIDRRAWIEAATRSGLHYWVLVVTRDGSEIEISLGRPDRDTLVVAAIPVRRNRDAVCVQLDRPSYLVVRAGVRGGVLVGELARGSFRSGRHCFAALDARPGRPIPERVEYLAWRSPDDDHTLFIDDTSKESMACPSPQLTVRTLDTRLHDDALVGAFELDSKGAGRDLLEVYAALDGNVIAEMPGRKLPAPYRLHIPRRLVGSHVLTFNAIYDDDLIGVAHVRISFDHE